MRLLILQAGFGAGGAEKVVAMLAVHRATAGDEVHVAALGAQTAATYFSYPASVRLHALAGGGGRAGQISRLLRIRQLLRDLRPDLAIAFLTKVNTLTLAAGIGLDVPVIVSERNNPRRQAAHPLWRPAQGLLMRRAAAIVMQTDRARRDLPHALWPRALVIANPCEPLPGFASQGPDGPLRLVAVGRLDVQKGFDLLIDAFSRLRNTRPTTLTIFGEGPERARLEALRNRLGLADRVALPGASAAPGGWIAEADILVVPSRFEGFPNVIAEAVVTGLPVVAFDCDYGPRELIRHGGNGLLVPPGDIDGLAEAIGRMIEDEGLRRVMTASAGVSRATL
ncbi:glycosyltransferase, partial [Tabrizicola sp.]|uniref:glycosyltransferase n=1 Tax=Tabrizicola sp. TaxID=2005166 RepID=UPI003F3ABE18